MLTRTGTLFIAFILLSGCGSNSGGGKTEGDTALDIGCGDLCVSDMMGEDSGLGDQAGETAVSDLATGETLDLLGDLGSDVEVAEDVVEVGEPDVQEEVLDVAPEVIEENVDWGGCPGYIAQGGEFQCAMIEMPVDHSVPDGAKIEVFLYRKPATEQAGRKQIWFLQGGPGGSGADFAQLFTVYSKAHPEWELLSLDHRGVGNSARLTCSQESSPFGFDYSGCAEELGAAWGEGLQKFSTTQAAHDLAELIELVRKPGVPVFVYGGSYGTYWALRHLRLFPEQVDGAILDSICSPGHCHLDDYDNNFNENGRLLMQQCDDDPVCGAKFANLGVEKPWDALGEVFARIDAGTLCDGEFSMLTRPMVRQFLGMAGADRMLRVLIPALVYRMHRCDDNDKEVLIYFFDAIQQMMGGGGFLEFIENYEDLASSSTLGTNIIISELVGERSLQEVQQIVDEAYFSTDASPLMKEIELSGEWPKYPDDGHMNRFGESATPLLMMNGSLDPQTTMAMALPTGEFYTGAHQTFVEFPYAPHGVLASSLTADGEMELMMGSVDYLLSTCGFLMFEAFVTDPKIPLDMGCISELAPLDYGTSSYLSMGLAMYLLGTDDMYDGQAGSSVFPVPIPRMVQPLR